MKNSGEVLQTNKTPPTREMTIYFLIKIPCATNRQIALQTALLPEAVGVMLSPKAILFDISNMLNKMAISEIPPDDFGKKSVEGASCPPIFYVTSYGH